MDAFISLSYHWVLSVHSIGSSHGAFIQDRLHDLCIQLQCDSSQAIVSTLPLPFLYSMLKVKLATDSTHWCWVASKLGVAMMQVSGLLSVLTMKGFQSKYSWNCSSITHFNAKNSCFMEWKLCSWIVRDQLEYATRQYWPSVCFWDSAAPNPKILASVSRRNGLSRSATANTGASRQALLRVSNVSLAFSVSFTHLLFLWAPSPVDAHVRVVQ